MTLQRSLAILPQSFYRECGCPSKKVGQVALKSPIFLQVFVSHQKEFNDLYSKLAAAIKPLYDANKDTLPVDTPKLKKELYIDVEAGKDDSDEDDGSESSEEEEIVKPKKKTKAKAKKSKAKK